MGTVMGTMRTRQRPPRALRLPSKMTALRLAAIAIPAIALAALAAQDALNAAMRTTRPDIAIATGRSDPLAQIRVADLLYAPRLKEAGARESARLLAQQSLRSEPLNARGLRLLAMIQETDGDAAAAAETAMLGRKVSRRDSGLNLWLVEKAVRKQDLPAILYNLDVAMRSSVTIRGRLFPVLLQALSTDPGFSRQFFADYIEKNPSWLYDFLDFGITEAKDARGIGEAVIAAGGMPRDAKFRPLESFLLTRLADQQHYTLARRLFLLMPGSDRRWLASAGFEVGKTDPAFNPITWQAYTSPDFTSSFLRDEKGAVTLDAVAYTPAPSLAARKIVFLPTGPHRFAVAAERTSPESAAMTATWQVRCAMGQDLPVLASRKIDRSVNLAFDVVVPERCEALMLELVVAGNASPDPGSMSFRAFRLD